MRDKETAAAFATSWNNLPNGSVYSSTQFEDWFFPIDCEQVKGKDVLELGCGNGSLMIHLCSWEPNSIVGVDLGKSVESCTENMNLTGFKNYSVLREDLISYRGQGYDLVYSIGVLHHLRSPVSGFKSVVANTSDRPSRAN